MGIILACAGIILAAIATGNRDIIGGADYFTFTLVFKYDNGGLYAAMTFWGFVAIVASIVAMFIKKK